MFRAFPKRDGARILLLESIDYEQMNSTEWLKKIRLIVMVRCCKLSLYANESCDEHVIYFRGLR